MSRFAHADVLDNGIAYLKANADKFGIDARRVGIVGGSAGGYLSAMAYKGL